jgi:hypothetical protein
MNLSSFWETSPSLFAIVMIGTTSFVKNKDYQFDSFQKRWNWDGNEQQKNGT